MKNLIEAAKAWLLATPAYAWLSQWLWVIVFVTLLLVGILLPALRALKVIAWPRWVVAMPLVLLIALVVFVIVMAADDLIRNGWH